MTHTNFVEENSIVRKIWGNSDTILFIFAGSAAEFALNKAVDWLYFTGRLPSDPLGRLFSTVAYARMIVFSEQGSAEKAIKTIASIHGNIEKSRGQRIPDWAYRDVMFMLIDYSIRAFELLERPLSPAEKDDIFDVFYRVGVGMGISGLPVSYKLWIEMRSEHLLNNLEFTLLTKDLFRQYRKHLGPLRYKLLLESQKLVIPDHVRRQMGFSSNKNLKAVIPIYLFFRKYKWHYVMKNLLLPNKFKSEINALDMAPS